MNIARDIRLGLRVTAVIVTLNLIAWAMGVYS